MWRNELQWSSYFASCILLWFLIYILKHTSWLSCDIPWHVNYHTWFVVCVVCRVYLYAFLSATSTGSGRWDAKTYLAPKWVSHWRFSSFSLGNEGGVRFREFIVDFLWSFRKFSKSFQIFFDSKKTLFSFLFFFSSSFYISNSFFIFHFLFFTFHFLYVFLYFSFFIF